MRNKRTILGVPLSWRRNLARSAAIAFLLITIPVAGFAQETTTRVRGVVMAPDGSPAPGATVTITDTRTGAQRAASTSQNGAFAFRGLPVGGPYTIRVQTEQYEDTLITDVFTSLSEEAAFNVQLQEQTEVEEIVVTAAMVQSMELAIGPGTSFSIEEIQSMPSIQRQIRDVIRIDPRVSLGRADNGA
ncbi:MAG TPA: carboxypeptidase-like regulatory domain-containing protein, partial [Woeseiaceae bacterium]